MVAWLPLAVAVFLVTNARESHPASPTAPAAAPPAASGDPGDPPVPVGVRRLPNSIACESRPPVDYAAQLLGTGGRPDGGAADPSKRIGSLDKEVIRRVIRRRINPVRACYEAVMGKTPPYKSGRVMTRFAISRTGTVRYSCLVQSTLVAPDAERCILEQELTWEFPRPLGDGWVTVDYPFVFTPATIPPAGEAN